MNEIMLKIDNVSKKYKLGQIGGTTLRDELQRKRAKLRKEEDPTKRIGSVNNQNGDEFLALNSISFEVKKGERIGIIGHNGAGKSTLLKLISRVTAPTSGTISMNGRVASMLEVGTGFHQELTGRENIYMNGAILGMTKKEIDLKINDIIDFSECRQFIDTPVKRYSSGMYVKLAFSVAAHLDSEILIMDEVLAVGDMAFQKKCIDKMNYVSKQDGRTILYVSHNMSTIRQLCDRVIVINCGRIIFDGKVEEGINQYYGNVLNNNTFYNYIKNQRKNNNFYSDVKFTFAKMNIINKKEAIYNRGEKIECEFLCFANKDCMNIKIRLEVECEGMIIGTMLSNAAINAKENNMVQFNMTINTISFTPGKYSITLLSYENNNGSQKVIERIENAIVFEITEEYINGLIWLNKYWGHVYLGNVDITNVLLFHESEKKIR